MKYLIFIPFILIATSLLAARMTTTHFAAEKSANLIGTNYDAGNLDYATHKGLHAALGCAAGSAKAAGGNNADQGCISGAYGGLKLMLKASFQSVKNNKSQPSPR